jgi:hypothetical protein
MLRTPRGGRRGESNIRPGHLQQPLAAVDPKCMITVLGIAAHVAHRTAAAPSASSLTEILGIAGAALSLTVLWVATRFLPRGQKRPALTVTRPRLGELRSPGPTAPRPVQGSRGRRTPVAR